MLNKLRDFLLARHMKKRIRLATESIYSEIFDLDELINNTSNNVDLLRTHIAVRVAADAKLGMTTHMNDLLKELKSSELFLREPDIQQSILKLCGAKAEVSLNKAEIKFAIDRLAPEYSYGWAVYEAEKAKKGPITFRQRERLKNLSGKLGDVECKIKEPENPSETDQTN